MLYSDIMAKLPKNYEQQLGDNQKLFRQLELDGREVLVRIQKPFEEESYEAREAREAGQLRVKIVIDEDGKKTINSLEDDYYLVWGTALVVETWSDATKSVITAVCRKSKQQTDEEFSFAVRYFLNHGSDEELIELIRSRGLDTQLRMQSKVGIGEEPVLPLPPKGKTIKKK